MKKIFVDTNVLVDLLTDREPFTKFAVEIFNKAASKQVKLFTSTHSIATTHYLLKKYTEEKQLRETLFKLLDFISIVAIDQDIIKKALKSKHKDFEDGVQIICAYSVENLDCIVTRNKKEFKNSEILVLSPDELVNRI